VTHGQSNVLARYLREVEGIAAEPLEGAFEAERFEGERFEGDTPEQASA
jgi:putative mRNA 3-end processing factor